MGVYSTYSLSESSNVYNNSKDNMLDLMIESAQNDMKMFDSVIELDFMHAYSEAGLVSVTEADDETAGKSIGKKLKELFEKIKNKVKTFINTFVAKIQNLMHNDVSLYKNNSKDFEKAKSSSKKITVDGYTPIYRYGKVESNISGISNSVINALMQLCSQIDSASSEDAIDKVLDQLSEDKVFKKINKSLNSFGDAFFATEEKKDDYELKADDFAAIEDVMKNGGKKIVDGVKAEGKNLEKYIDAMKKASKYEKYMAGYLDDKDADLTIAKENAKYKVCNKFASVVSKITSAYCNSAARYVAAARKGFMAASRKGASLNESADLDFDAYILGEASDIYVEHALSMVG